MYLTYILKLEDSWEDTRDGLVVDEGDWLGKLLKKRSKQEKIAKIYLPTTY